MPLFNYALRCRVCKDKLTGKFTTREQAIEAGRRHKVLYTRTFNEFDHDVVPVEITPSRGKEK